MKVSTSILNLIGNTPLIKLSNYQREEKLLSNIYAKLEYYNPFSSIKDRIALEMINELEKNNKIKKGDIILEATSGNTGIGLSAIGNLKGYKVVIIMPKSCSIERRKIMEDYNAKVILVDGNMEDCIKLAKSLEKRNQNFIYINQFSNPVNYLTHYKTTAQEIYWGLNGEIDVFICGIGSGGTITGIGKYLKEKIPNIKIIGVEPKESPFFTKHIYCNHKIQGIGSCFIPDILDLNVIDEIVDISYDEAIEELNKIGKTESLLVGISSGAILKACVIEALKVEGRNIVCIFPDDKSKYLSCLGETND